MKRAQSGFTIVELLIVIVIIGILAAITIVAYNGIQNRARVSTVSSALSQANKKLATYAVDGNGYPANLATIDINNTGDVAYQYSFNNSVSPATYCVTATSGAISYKSSSTSPAPASGGCAGHGVGGVAAITNRILNPSFEAGNANNGGNITASGGTRTFPGGGGLHGSQFMRATFASTTALGWGQYTDNLEPGTYTGIFSVRSNIPMSFQPYFEGSAAKTTVATSGTLALTPNTWRQLWTTVNVTATGTVKVGGYFVNTGTTPTIGVDYIDFDSIMLVAGSSVPTYADGTSTNWVWNGTANASTSTGPGL